MFFNKIKFANIIKKIKDTYNSQEEFAEKSGIGRTYLSQYMNMKLNNPPKLNILKKLADASNGITTYKELQLICNYIDDGLAKISGDSLHLSPNPYIDKSECTPAEEYIYSIIYTNEIISSTNYSPIEIQKILKSYNYIKNDVTYCHYIDKHEKLKKQYCSNDKNVDTPEIRAIARDVAKLKPEKKELFKNLLKQMSDEADEANKK